MYLPGYTNSNSGIVTVGAHQTTIGGGYDAYLVKFNSSGQRQWGTYYGGSGSEYGLSCTTDATGNVYLAGQTSSNTGIATAGAHQTVYGGGVWDAFLVKFNGASVGINEITNTNLFSVYPNPAQSVINVKADAKLIGSAYIFYDNTGKVVLSGKINAENTSIELGNLSAGIYLFSVGENVKQTFKVIKE